MRQFTLLQILDINPLFVFSERVPIAPILTERKSNSGSPPSDMF